MFAQIPGELFHLKRQRMRFHQRHALDGIGGKTLGARDHLEKIAPPQRFIRGFRLGDVEAKRMLQRVEIHLVGDHRDVEQ